MIKIVTLVATVAGLLLRFLPGGFIARIALGLVTHWRLALIGVVAGAVFFGGMRAGYLGGYTRGESAGFDKGVSHHAELVRQENAKRAALAVESERAVAEETAKVRKASTSPRDAKRRLCNIDPNCRNRLRKPRKARKLVRQRQLADDRGDTSSERSASRLLR